MKLPKPDCKYGYSLQYLEDNLPTASFDSLICFMSGQTIAMCDGREYNHDTKTYEDTGCGPHGSVIYSTDFRKFLTGRKVLD